MTAGDEGATGGIAAFTLVREWRAFASEFKVVWRGQTRSWRDHILGDGYVDETRLIQPNVFPAFAARFLNFEVGTNMSPEEPGEEGKPDFTPADPVTHPFVFETKSTTKGLELNDPLDLAQVLRYLTEGRPRIRFVVLTNLAGLRVFVLGERGELLELYSVRLRDLLLLNEDQLFGTSRVTSFARFIAQFSRRELTSSEKIQQIRSAHPWHPAFEVTSSRWVIGRLDRVVLTLQTDVLARIATVADPTSVTPAEKQSILDELHLLGSRIAENLAHLPLDGFLSAKAGSPPNLVLEQYAMHVAYYMATRLLLVRTWEDLGLLKPMLHDGGFDAQMCRFDDAIGEVVEHSFSRARDVYRSLFQHSNNYSWFTPSEDVYIDAIYELAFTYLGQIDSDILGQVYERLLARIDRKLLGQYYTPRDVIGLIWDLIDVDDVAARTEADGRAPRILDVATGSGGFLVEAVHRLRSRLQDQTAAGASIHVQDWLNSVAEGINGVEIQYFSRYLAELNLLVQMGRMVAGQPGLRIAPIGVIAADTLSLHEPLRQVDLELVASDAPERTERLRSVIDSGFTMDVACGNPPYIGEKLAAPLLKRTREQHPYWEAFVAEHLDYLYWFLVLGISKLAAGGRFGFITTEYWLRAAGAKPLRRYIAEHCEVERIVLFRDLRLFPDAPGQHLMIITGTRRTAPGGLDGSAPPTATRPVVSIYEGLHLPTAKDRVALMDAVREARSAAGVRSFRAQISPHALGASTWGDVVLTRRQIRQRARLTQGVQVSVAISKGVETTLNALSTKTAALLPAAVLEQLGWPDTKPGIQQLTDKEVRVLGPLNTDERRALRRVINTRDVYPYAAVIPNDADAVIYLVKPDDITWDTPMQQVVSGTPFPDGLPVLERHLELFRPVLEAATINRGERRPWWTLHRPRFNVIGTGANASWEPYCLTSRWGGGSRLVVGVAPPSTSPASGLHILRPWTEGIGPGYLAALYNSSIYQAIVDSLPPGNVRAEELLRIGAPLLADEAAELNRLGLRLAETVRALVTQDAQRFPLLRNALRADASLRDLPTSAWQPREGPRTLWGRLDAVSWIGRVDVLRSPKQSFGEVVVTDSLFGRTVEAHLRGGEPLVVRVQLAAHTQPETAHILAALMEGASDRGAKARDVPGLVVPTSEVELQAVHGHDTDALTGRISEYKLDRRRVDDILESLVS